MKDFDFVSLRFNFSFNWQSSTANLFSLSLSFLYSFFFWSRRDHEQVNGRYRVEYIQRYRYSGAASSSTGGVSSLGGLRVISGPNRAAISGGKAGSGQTNVIPLEFKISLINTPRNEWYTFFFLRWVIFFHVLLHRARLICEIFLDHLLQIRF